MGVAVGLGFVMVVRVVGCGGEDCGEVVLVGGVCTSRVRARQRVRQRRVGLGDCRVRPPTDKDSRKG